MVPPYGLKRTKDDYLCNPFLGKVNPLLSGNRGKKIPFCEVRPVLWFWVFRGSVPEVGGTLEGEAVPFAGWNGCNPMKTEG